MDESTDDLQQRVNELEDKLKQLKQEKRQQYAAGDADNDDSAIRGRVQDAADASRFSRRDFLKAAGAMGAGLGAAGLASGLEIQSDYPLSYANKSSGETQFEVDPDGTITADTINSRVSNGVVNLKKWRDDNGFGDIGAAFNDAIQWLEEKYGGGTVYLPAGDYSIDTRIMWTDDTISLDTPIDFVGAGRGTTVSTTVDDRSIIIGRKNRYGASSIRDISFDCRGQNADTTFLMLGDNSGDYTDDLRGPSWFTLQRVNMRGGGDVRGYEMQFCFWLRVDACDFQHAPCIIGVSGKNRANQGIHTRVHYDAYNAGNGGDYGMWLRGEPHGHEFYQCKFTGEEDSAIIGVGGGGHIFSRTDQEGSGGPIRVSETGNQMNTPNIFFHPGGGGTAEADILPGNTDILIGGGDADASVMRLPRRGYLFMEYSRLHEWPNDGNGPGVGGRHTDTGDLVQIFQSEWGRFNDTAIYRFRGGVPGDWTEDHAGGAASASSLGGGGVELSTGAATGNVARIDFGGAHFVKWNRYPFIYCEFQHNSTENVRMDIGLTDSNGDASRMTYDTDAGDTTWGLTTDLGEWYHDDSSDIIPQANTLSKAFIAFVTADADGPQPNDGEIGGRIYIDGNNANDYMTFGDSSNDNDYEPYIEIETYDDVDKTLTVKLWAYAQRNTPGLGP